MGEFIFATFVPFMFMVIVVICALMLQLKFKGIGIITFITVCVLFILMIVSIFYIPDMLGIEITKGHPTFSGRYSISPQQFFGSIVGAIIWSPLCARLAKIIQKE